MQITNFNDSLIDLRTILEVMEKIGISERLEIDKTEQITKYELKKLEIVRIGELEELERKITFTTLKTDFGRDQIVLKKN